MRINARLDDESRAQVDYLVQTTGQSVSHVVREAVAHYYARVRSGHKPMSKFLALAGTGDSGRSDIASNVKRDVTAILDDKFPR